ncbi:hypothetical protein [Nonomuraea zeae]|uniref:Uncharacterized protein n=1 Tax=Nonomuraea zeae TaxID=1642303 RepID=A0A5S4G6H6_9ACTN|nr:hypothetical protein [Nonomuraea zeae]TMR28613.1 hypothetical protein ETD85_35230 [Nonomuraea zeae]
MDDLERRLGALLSDPPGGEVPPELAGRIRRAVAARRRSRRAIGLAAAACAAAVVVAVPLAVRTGNADPATTANLSPTAAPTEARPRPSMPAPAVTVTVTGGTIIAGSASVRFEEMLRGLMTVSDLVEIDARTASGEPFVPATLGRDGTVLGTTPGGQVAEAGPDGGAPKELGISARSGLGSDAAFRTWTQRDGSAAGQRCRAADGTTHTVSPQGADPGAPVWVDGGVIVGSDVMRRPWMAKGCSGPGTVVGGAGPLTGDAVAFSYPYLFTTEPANDKVLRVIDVERGSVAAEHPLPEGVLPHSMGEPDQKWYAAASGQRFAWVAGNMLRWVPRDTWGPASTLGSVPPPDKGVTPWLTAGNRLITYNAGGTSILFDPVTGQRRKNPEVMLAAGDWLLWKHDDRYRLARVR